MDNANLPPLYIGQKVVSNCNYYNLIKGKNYQIQFIKKECCCKKAAWIVSIINYTDDYSITQCPHCLAKIDGRWFNVDRFSETQESIFPSLTFEKVVEKESQLISLN